MNSYAFWVKVANDDAFRQVLMNEARQRYVDVAICLFGDVVIKPFKAAIFLNPVEKRP